MISLKTGVRNLSLSVRNHCYCVGELFKHVMMKVWWLWRKDNFGINNWNGETVMYEYEQANVGY